MNTVIVDVDAVKPNVYTDEDKYRWLAGLEGLLSAEVFQDPEIRCPAVPEDADRPLRVEPPYDEVYRLYLMAMIDFHNREYGNYNNSITLFNTAYLAYEKYYNRTHKPISKKFTHF